MNIVYSKDQLQELVNNSHSFSDILRSLGKPIHGGLVDHIKKRLIHYEIDYSHFKGRGWRSGVRLMAPSRIGRTKEQFVEHFLVNNGPFITTDNLKKKLISFGVLESICDVCGNKGEWNNMPLTLQLDHKNGIRNDNRLDNLRILCPNCHTQTETYSGKNNGELT